jgi:CBS-domain-containing membrane protein
MTLRFTRSARRATLRTLTAADLMTTNPRSVDQNATVAETTEFFREYGVHTAPVIDEAGRPVGTVSRSDLVESMGSRRDRLLAKARGASTYDALDDWSDGLVADLKVMQIMTPVVFCVPVDAPIETVVQKVLALELRCLFVTDEHGVLVGVISIFNLLKSITEPAGRTRSIRSRDWATASSSFAGLPPAYWQTEPAYAPS